MQGAGGSSIRKRQGGLGPFAIISLSYILFTTTDGGVRIIVLLHAYQQGFTALALAAIFAGYELAGMIVNLLAGMVGARWGIKATLLAGLTFQLAALAMLFGWQVGKLASMMADQSMYPVQSLMHDTMTFHLRQCRAIQTCSLCSSSNHCIHLADSTKRHWYGCRITGTRHRQSSSLLVRRS